MEYEVVVIGAGPAGSAAAKASAERGAKTILLEEHTMIGVPTHCMGALGSVVRPDLVEEILGTMDKRVVIREPGDGYEHHVYAPSGKLVQVIPRFNYVVDRAIFDQELAKQAINAGAELLLNTRVTALLKQGGKVIGVTTNSRGVPKVLGKVVIAADGISGGVRGIAKLEGLTRKGQTNVHGITMELARVKDCKLAGGSHAGSFLASGFAGILPYGPASCVTHFTSLAEFERVKAGNYLLSKSLKNAVPIRIDGWSHTSDLGVRFPEIVKEGLILTGSAANWRTTVVAVVSGRCAGEVAAEAVQEGDVSAENLSKFIDLYEKTGLIKDLYSHSSKFGSHPFAQRSDEDIEKLLFEMNDKDGLTYVPSAPVTGTHGRE